MTAKCTSSYVTGTPYARGAEMFIFDEIAVNENIPLEAEDKESVFGMERNPAARFVLRIVILAFFMLFSFTPCREKARHHRRWPRV